jgi:putative transposase
VDKALKEARSNPSQVVLLFQDEASIYRQPSQACLFGPRGREQPNLPYACGANTVMRVAGFLNACTGELHAWDASKITADRLAKYFKQVCAAYPAAQKIYVVMDNWPVHFHPKVEQAIGRDPRMQALRLPTYSPWLNPIEKLWRLLKQNVSHTHTMAQDFDGFKKTVRAFLAKPTDQPTELLQYVGLFS